MQTVSLSSDVEPGSQTTTRDWSVLVGHAGLGIAGAIAASGRTGS